MGQSIAVIILARNDEVWLPAALESVKWVNQIIIVDNGSTDQTLKIAGRYTDQIIKVDHNSGPIDFSLLRNAGLDKVNTDWVFYLDSDERVLAPLKTEIEKIISNDSAGSAWAVPRRNIILGEEKRYNAFWPDHVIRLFKKSKLKGWTGKVHEQPDFEGKLQYLSEPLLHLTHRDIDSMVLKSLSWANIDAKLRLDANHPAMTGWRFLRIVITEMWQQGVARRGFFNGTVGMIDCLLQVFSLYLSYVKLWQLQLKTPLPKVYENIDQKLIENDFKY
jgi:glycosyltransferase involved in cell wall biosynthesis